MTTKIRLIITRGLLSSFIAILSAGTLLPLATYADTTCTAPDTSNQPGVHRPVGADSSLYTYNCGSLKWVSSHFTYDPATGLTTANDPTVYTYNPSTGNYDAPYWAFNAPSGAYVARTLSVAQPPAGATVIGGPAPIVPTQIISNTGAGSTNTINNNGTSGGTQTINGTGAGSTNAIAGTNSNNLTGNNTNNLTVGNTLNGTATTGAVLLTSNTVAGNATSGNAQDVANILNMLQSASNALGSGNVVTFVKNINGDVNGDLLLDPAALGAVQPAGAPLSGNTNLTVNNSTNATINNNINLNANSGTVTANANTTAGNVTSGSAQAIANVVNVINSAIGAGKSFIGTININGNLNGDILLPPSFIDQLVASSVPTVTLTNTGANSTNAVNNANSNNTNVTNTNNQGITNNVNAGATSGTVTASKNTTAGNIASGTANTSITAFNLTGSNVLGSNDILVFVNVLGKWVGMIVNAPAGATAAELGGGLTNISNTGANSANSVANSGSNNTTFNNTTTQQINNNITANASTGNTSATRNTKVGNVTSGNANVAVNLLNVQNSTFSLSNWFGILFINVFGTWHGSFGINTPAGDPMIASQLNNAGATNHGGSGFNSPTQVFSFIAHGPTTGNSLASGTGSNNNAGANYSLTDVPASVLAAQTVKASQATTTAPIPQLQAAHNSLGRTSAIIGAATLFFIVSDAFFSRHKAHNA